MSETQLREAYALMKAGDKQGASQLIQNVLKADRSNVNAWWLFSHVLEDEDKVVKSLEKILALDSNHAGARKKLASLRPEYAELAPVGEEAKAKTKTDQQNAAYWSKLDNEYKIREKAYTKHLIETSPYMMRLKVAMFVVPVFLIIVGVAYFQSQQSLPDTSGDTPQSLAEQYYIAIYIEDEEALRKMFCPERSEKLEELLASFEGYAIDYATVDTSEMSFELEDYSEDKAYVTIHGVLRVNFGGTELNIDMDEEAASEGYDAYGMFFERQNGVWLVCNPYAIYDLEYDDGD